MKNEQPSLLSTKAILDHSEILRGLVSLFKEFPGIGPRQATRFVYFLLRHQSISDDLIYLIHELKKTTSQCSRCFRYMSRNGNMNCNICASDSRDIGIILIVSGDSDVDVIEKSGGYLGTYFILGGLLPPLEENVDRYIRARALVSRISKEMARGSLKEIIFALSANTEGDATSEYLVNLLKPVIADLPVRITHLGRGLSTGTEIEYSDTETITSALKNRFSR